MIHTAMSERRSTATAAPTVAFADAAAGGGRALSGFRLIDPAASSDDAARRPKLRAIAGCGILPLPVGLDASAAGEAEGAFPAVADALPIDGSWRWLGLLSCWLSSALVASVLVVALH
jgi:hypothetical protein